jgi:hypothetical protein
MVEFADQLRPERLVAPPFDTTALPDGIGQERESTNAGGGIIAVLERREQMSLDGGFEPPARLCAGRQRAKRFFDRVVNHAHTLVDDFADDGVF